MGYRAAVTVFRQSWEKKKLSINTELKWQKVSIHFFHPPHSVFWYKSQNHCIAEKRQMVKPVRTSELNIETGWSEWEMMSRISQPPDFVFVIQALSIPYSCTVRGI